MRSDALKSYARTIAALCGFFVLAAPAWPSTVDDVYITLTYARHWAEAGVLEWTSGERVEGYSNFLFMALMALFSLAHIDIDVAAKVLALTAGCSLVVYFSHKLPMSVSGTLPIIALVTWAPLSHWSVIGLEGTVYTALLTAGWVYTLGSPSRWGAGIAMLAIASLTRPEGALHVLAGLSTYYLRGTDAHRTRWPALAALCSLVIYHSCRYAWFGAFMPTSYLVKITPTYATQYGVYQLFGDLLTAAGLGVALVVAGRPKTRDIAWICVPLFIQAATLIRASGDWMAWGRITMPGVVSTAIVFATYASWRTVRPMWMAFSLIATLMASAFEPRGYGSIDLRLRDYSRLTQFVSHFQHGIDTPVAEDVSWVINNVPYGATGMAVDVGMLGDIPEFRLIDMRGLTHRPAAEAIAAQKEEDWLKQELSNTERKPTFLRLATWGGDSPTSQADWSSYGYRLSTELRYGGGLIQWFTTTGARPSLIQRADRWDEVLRRHPAHPFLRWHAALAAADVGSLHRAQELLSIGAHTWPAMPEFAANADSLSFTQSSRALHWTVQKGFNIECNTHVRSRMLSAGEQTEVFVESTKGPLKSNITTLLSDPCTEDTSSLPTNGAAKIEVCETPRQLDIDVQCAQSMSDVIFVRLRKI